MVKISIITKFSMSYILSNSRQIGISEKHRIKMEKIRWHEMLAMPANVP